MNSSIDNRRFTGKVHLTKEEVKDLIEALVKKYEDHFDPPIERWDEDKQFDPPTRKDWEYLESKDNCSFRQEFVAFMELITRTTTMRSFTGSFEKWLEKSEYFP